MEVPGGYGGTAYAAAYSPVTNQVSGGVTASYDANGNQLTSTPATLTWNALNQPVTVNSTTATYDALGRMVEKGLSGVYTQFVYRPSGGMLAVYSGTLSKGTISLPGGSTAVYNASGLNYIRHKDWLGSSRLATTWAHAVYSKEAYAPFGEVYNEAGTPDRSFTGQDQNVATGPSGSGAYDFLFRKYDPSAGRWLSPDPAGWGAVNLHHPQSLNRYAYVQNQPLGTVDPAGLDPTCVSPGDEGCESDGSGDEIESDVGNDDVPSSSDTAPGGSAITAHNEQCGDAECWVGDFDGEIDCSGSVGCLEWYDACGCWGAISISPAGQAGGYDTLFLGPMLPLGPLPAPAPVPSVTVTYVIDRSHTGFWSTPNGGHPKPPGSPCPGLAAFTENMDQAFIGAGILQVYGGATTAPYTTGIGIADLMAHVGKSNQCK